MNQAPSINFPQGPECPPSRPHMGRSGISHPIRALGSSIASLIAAPWLCAQPPTAIIPPAGDPAQPQNTPSRLIAPEQMEPHLQAMVAMLSMRNRATDPFGQYQDPNARPIIKSPVAKATRRTATAQTIAFPDIIKRITVNTVMPKERQFLIGTRVFRQGDRMNLTFRMKNIPVEIVDVSSQRIDFRNLDSGETASLTINLMPAGMRAGTSGISAPGMVRDEANAPIELDSATNSEELSQTR